MSRESVRHGALLSVALWAGLLFGSAASAQAPQGCSSCQSGESCGYCNGKPCPPWVKYRFEGPPRIKFKHGCPRPLCNPCDLPHYGYFQTCWQPWPFPPDWSHCPTPPPGTMVPYEHPGRRQTVFEQPPAEAPPPRRTEPGNDKGTSTEPTPAPPPVSVEKIVPTTGQETVGEVVPTVPPKKSELPPPPPSPMPSQEGKGTIEEPPALPKLTPTPEPPRAETPPAVKQVAAMSTVEQAQRPRNIGSSDAPIRMVNSRRIMLDYDLSDVPRPEQTELELWFTQDGKKWSKDQTSLRGGSPYLVEVNREGTYGFTLIARRPGDKSMGPAAGEAPQVWVEVDWTKPKVHMVHSQSGKQPRELDVIWIATDNNLARQPITLSYADKPEGPWKPFASNIENSGRYSWQAPADVPGRVWIRVEATDLVGNIGSSQTPMPAVIR
jgi:hypothetical protein